MQPIYTGVSGAFNATAGAKTALNVIAGANQNIGLRYFKVSCDGSTATETPLTVDICQSTQATAGTAGSTPTAVQAAGRALAFQGSLAAAYSAEPTALTVIDSFYLPQFMGVYAEALPLGEEYETDFSGGTVRAIAIRVNLNNTHNVKVTARFAVWG